MNTTPRLQRIAMSSEFKKGDSDLPKEQGEGKNIKADEHSHSLEVSMGNRSLFTEDKITPKQANEDVSVMTPQIHLSGEDGNTVEEATQLVFHKMADDTLFVEWYPHSNLKNVVNNLQVTLSDTARKKLIDFLQIKIK